jgi:adenylate cyclase
MNRLPLTARQLRLASGLVLLTYLTMHLFTHMSGLISLAVAEAGLRLSMRVWQSVPGTAALYGAFTLHIALALRTIYLRRHWQLPVIEWVRLWAGFSLPLLLIGHVVATRVAVAGYGFQPSYTKIIAGLIASGSQGWQVALLAPGWVHGCLGVWLSLRHRPLAQRLRPLLLAVLVAVPLLSAAGFVRMSRTIAGQGPVAVAPDPGKPPVLNDWRHGLLGAYGLLLVGSALAGRWRSARTREAEPGGTMPASGLSKEQP